MSIEDTLSKINKKNWYVSGAYQRDDFEWSVSLRPKGDWSFSHGSGKTLEQALLKAVENVKNHKTEKDWKKIGEEGNKTKAIKSRTRLKATRKRKSSE